MSYAVTFDVPHKRVMIVPAPPLTEHDALECFREVRTDPKYRTDFGILINLLAVDIPPGLDAAAHVGAVMKAFFPGQRIALIAHNPAPAEAYQLLCAHASPVVDMRVFGELSAAEAWLAS